MEYSGTEGQHFQHRQGMIDSAVQVTVKCRLGNHVLVTIAEERLTETETNVGRNYQVDQENGESALETD